MKKEAAFAAESVEKHAGQYRETACRLWDRPELKFAERESCRVLLNLLRKEGFSVEEGTGLPTAFRASWGSGSPVIGFLGEYDALPGLCQAAGVCHEEKIPGRADAGHGCGHHLLGTALLGAAVALKEYLEEEKLPGTVVYYGCPAEEGGSGKVWMLREGVFQKADALFSWHPDSVNRVSPNDVLATIVMEYVFHGTASHAASAPEAGRGALEAAELMGVGLGFLREHLPDTARVHYAYIDAGGTSTNVIQPRAAVQYQIRSPRIRDAAAIKERINDLARGAALMTRTREEIRFVRATSELRVNETLNDLLYEALCELGRPKADEESLALAGELHKTLPPQSAGSTERKLGILYGEAGEELAERIRDQNLVEEICPRRAVQTAYWASTDVGDVSQAKPVGFLNVACYGKDVPLHTWQAVAFGKSSFALEGMLTAARVIGAAAMALAGDPEKLEAAKREWESQNTRDPYVCPVPEEARPPL